MSSDTPTLAYADLHLLTVLAQTRSYTQAARRLGVSKASASMRIAELERSLGLPLVRRTTRAVGLTAAGQQLVDDIGAAFARIEQGVASAKDLAGAPRGLVRVSAPVALGRQHIAPTLPTFARAWPEIRIELDLSDRFVNLAQEGFDLAIRHAQAAPDTQVATVLCDTRSVLVASPDYLARAGEPKHPAELARHQCLLYLRGAAGQSWAFEKSGGRRASGASAALAALAASAARDAAPERVAVAVGGPLKANNSEVLREAALGGLGIALLPDFSAAEALRAGRLRRVLPAWSPRDFFGERIYAIRPWSPQPPRAVQCLVDHLKETLGRGFALPVA
ncbi:LysR family transcriptional regulator [Hylemonella sp. W303a]|uniref:LysR family transcriptional regulator n=1 Tax=Hylemonella sp. W303a TaxID=3389873 RepID=UPI00396AFD39